MRYRWPLLLSGLAFMVTVGCSRPSPPASRTAITSPPAARIVLYYERRGGVAGFCERLTVTQDGMARLETCRGTVRQASVTRQDWEILGALIRTYRPFRVEQQDPESQPDGMYRLVEFHGQGRREADEQARALVFRLAEYLIQQIQGP